MSDVTVVILVAVWAGAMWWALRAFGPLGIPRTRATGPGVVSIGGPESRGWLALFMLGHLLVLAGVLVRLRTGLAADITAHVILLSIGETILACLLLKCETDTIAEPKLINLSITYNLKTVPEYERVVLWRRALWLYEKPVLTFLAAGIAIGGYTAFLVVGDPDYRFVAGFGANLLLTLWITFRYTTLAVRPRRVTLHRWLSFTPVREVDMSTIAKVTAGRTALQAFFGYGTLRIQTRSGRGLKIVLRRPEQFVEIVERLRRTPTGP